MGLNHSRSTTMLTTGGLIRQGVNYVSSIILAGDGTNVATLSIFDSTTGAGNPVITLVCPAGQRQVTMDFTHSIALDNALYTSISGTGASYMIGFGG